MRRLTLQAVGEKCGGGQGDVLPCAQAFNGGQQWATNTTKRQSWRSLPRVQLQRHVMDGVAAVKRQAAEHATPRRKCRAESGQKLLVGDECGISPRHRTAWKEGAKARIARHLR